MSQETAGVSYGIPRTGPKHVTIGNPAVQVFREVLVENVSATDEIEIPEGLVMIRDAEDVYKPLRVAEIPSVPTEALNAALVVVVDKKARVPVQDGDGPGTRLVCCAATAELDREMVRFADGEKWPDLTAEQRSGIDDALRVWGLTLAERQNCEA